MPRKRSVAWMGVIRTTFRPTQSPFNAEYRPRRWVTQPSSPGSRRPGLRRKTAAHRWAMRIRGTNPGWDAIAYQLHDQAEALAPEAAVLVRDWGGILWLRTEHALPGHRKALDELRTRYAALSEHTCTICRRQDATEITDRAGWDHTVCPVHRDEWPRRHP